MGHYDDCYEADAVVRTEKLRKEVQKEFLNYLIAT